MTHTQIAIIMMFPFSIFTSYMLWISNDNVHRLNRPLLLNYPAVVLALHVVWLAAAILLFRMFILENGWGYGIGYFVLALISWELVWPLSQLVWVIGRTPFRRR